MRPDDHRFDHGFGKTTYHCDWHVADIATHEPALLAVTIQGEWPDTQLSLFDAATLTGTASKLPNVRAGASTLVDLEGSGEPVLALAGDSGLVLVWDWNQFPEPCMEQLDVAADSFAVGDHDGDGRQELAILHEGTIRVLHVP